jgi:hypothetical protein
MSLIEIFPIDVPIPNDLSSLPNGSTTRDRIPERVAFWAKLSQPAIKDDFFIAFTWVVSRVVAVAAFAITGITTGVVMATVTSTERLK